MTFNGIYKTRNTSQVEVKNNIGTDAAYEYAYDDNGNVTHIKDKKPDSVLMPIMRTNHTEHPMDLMERLTGLFKFEKDI